MTTQAPDFYIMDERQYSVVQLMEGGSLFIPDTYGLTPTSVSTACWRGFQALYTVVDGLLVLSALSINLSQSDQEISSKSFPPKLNGISPQLTRGVTSEWEYLSVNLALEYTGRIIIGSGVVNPRLIGGMSIEAWNYYDVFGIDFKNGEYQGKVDLSESMKGYRKSKGYDEPSEYKKRVYSSDWRKEAYDLEAFFKKQRRL